MANPADPAIIIRSLEEAIAALQAALEAGQSIWLQSPENAAQTMGPALYKAILEEAANKVPDAAFQGLYDCADKPGHATAALRAGLKHILLTSPDDARTKVVDMADQMEAEVIDETGPVFDPASSEDDPLTACTNWLKAL